MFLKYFMQKIAQDNVPEIEKRSCLHYRNVKKQCSKCVETCPTSAIIKKGDTLIVEEELCIGCGICKVNCPSQAITMKHFGENNIPKAIENNELVVFGCHYGKAEGNVMLPCLNGLHPEFLTILFLHYRDKKLSFNLSKCSHCTISKGASTFENSLKKALEFLKNIKIEEQHHIILDNKEVPQLAPKAISRRELFNIIKEGSVNQATEMVNSMWGNSKDHSLDQRGILIDVINRLSKERPFEVSSENKMFSNYQINTKCDGCSYCKAICPYKAWRVEETEDTYTLSHDVGKCRTCNQCLETCPQKAIERVCLTSDAFKGSIEKIKKPIIKCKQCSGTFVLKEEDRRLCTACLKRDELRKSLFKKS